MATIHKNFNVDLQSHHIVCNPTDRSRGFTMGGETPTVILTVRRNTPAEKAGLQNGDYILQIGPKSVHMLNCEGVEKVLAGMSDKGFEITVAHVSPWPRNLTEKKYAISKIKRLWEMEQKTKWGPLQVDKHPGQGEGEGSDTLSPPTESGVTISRWNEGADVDFSAEFDSDEEPPPSDEDEIDDGSEQAEKEWMELFKDGKKMVVVKGKVKGKVAPKREQDWASVQSQAGKTAAPPPVSPGRRIIAASKENAKEQSSPDIKIQVKEHKQVSPSHHNAPPHRETPPRRDTPPHHDAPPRHDTPPRHTTPPRHDTPPRHTTPPRHDTPPRHTMPPRHNTPPRHTTPPRHDTPSGHGASPYQKESTHHPSSRKRHSPQNLQSHRDMPPPAHSDRSPTSAGQLQSRDKHQVSLSPWQHEAPPKHQTTTLSANRPVPENRSSVSHTMGNSSISPAPASSTASTVHSHSTSHRKVTPEKVVVRSSGRPAVNIPPPPSDDQRPLVRVLRKEDVEKTHQSSQPTERQVTATIAAKRNTPEPNLSTVHQKRAGEGDIVRVPTQPSPQRGVSAGQAQLGGGAGSSYLNLAGMKQTQQEATVTTKQPSLSCSEPEFATLCLPFPVTSWTTADVCQWLKQLNPHLHNSYMPAFYKYRMTGKHLMQVSKRALQKLGASSVEHLEVLWRSIEELKEYEAGLCIPDLDEGNEVTFL